VRARARRARAAHFGAPLPPLPPPKTRPLPGVLLGAAAAAAAAGAPRVALVDAAAWAALRERDVAVALAAPDWPGAADLLARLEAAAAASADAGGGLTWARADCARDAALCAALGAREGERAPHVRVVAAARGGGAAPPPRRVPAAAAATATSLADFAARAVRPPVEPLAPDGARAAVAARGAAGVAFVLVEADGGGGGGGDDLAAAFDRAALALHGHAAFFRATAADAARGELGAWLARAEPRGGGGGGAWVAALDAEADAPPAALRSAAAARALPYARGVVDRLRAAAAAEADGGAARAALDGALRGEAGAAAGALLAWATRHAWPRLSQLTPATLAAARADGRLLAVAALGDTGPEGAAFAHALDRLADAAASPLARDVREAFIFAVVERAEFPRWSSQFAFVGRHELLVADTLRGTYFRDPTVREEEDAETWCGGGRCRRARARA